MERSNRATGEAFLKKWRVRDARARFSEMLNAAVKDGPQLLTRRGVEVAVMVSTEPLARMRASAGLEPKAAPRSKDPSPSEGLRPDALR
jgi:antitoxin Phd